jgi:uncharacterized protein involved in exopolysaccharide biosynthesis
MSDAEEPTGRLEVFLYVLFKHWVMVAAVFVAIVATVTVMSLIVPNTFEATSKILVKFGQENVSKPTAKSTGGASGIALDRALEKQMNSQVELLRGGSLVSTVIADIGAEKLYPGIGQKYRHDREVPVTDRAVLLFLRTLAVEAQEESDAITIRFQHRNPVLAAKAVNKLVNHFKEYHAAAQPQPQIRGFLKEPPKPSGEHPRVADNPPQADVSVSDIALMKEQRERSLKQVSSVEVSLAETKGRINEVEEKLRSLRAYHPGSAAPIQLDQDAGLNQEVINSIRGRLTDLKLKEQELLNKYTEKSYKVTAVRAEIKEAQQLLAKEEEAYQDKALLSLTSTLKALKARVGDLKEELDRYEKELGRTNRAELELTERASKRVSEMEQLKASRIKEQEAPSKAVDRERAVSIIIAETAFVPARPIKPNMALNIVLSAVLGALLGLGLAFFSEHLSHTFNNPGDVERQIGLPVLASITRARL